MRTNLKLAAAAGGGLVLGAAVVATVAIATPRITTAGAVPTAPPVSSPTPIVPPGGAKADPAKRAVSRALVQAEAQVLGITPQQLQAALKQGTTVHQLADQKGVSQATFQASFVGDLTTLLGQDVSQGVIPQAQEATILQRYRSRIPHWDQAASPHPSPTPS
jgi:hypothetical protein